jgi:hypothetical protein
MSKVTALVSADKPLIRIYGGDGKDSGSHRLR